jgi:uroporphyrinogen-III synthase
MPPRLHCAAIGPGTAAALAAYGVAAAWVPSAFASEVLAEEIPISAGQRVLRLRAAVAAEIGTVLRARGAVVDDVIAYRTIEAPPESVPLLLDAFADGVDAVVLASASAARGLVTLAGAAGIGTRLLEVPVVAIGPVTAEAASAAGLRVEMVAGEYSIDGITAVIRRRLVGA